MASQQPKSKWVPSPDWSNPFLFNTAIGMGAQALRMLMDFGPDPKAHKERYINSVISQLRFNTDQQTAHYRDRVGTNPLDFLYSSAEPSVEMLSCIRDAQVREVEDFLRSVLQAPRRGETNDEGGPQQTAKA